MDSDHNVCKALLRAEAQQRQLHAVVLRLLIAPALLLIQRIGHVRDRLKFRDYFFRVVQLHIECNPLDTFFL